MKKLALAVVVLALVAGAASAQQEKNLPNSLVTVEDTGEMLKLSIHYGNRMRVLEAKD